MAGLVDKFSVRSPSWSPQGPDGCTESSHDGAETTPLFNAQLITSHCLLLPKGEVSIPPTPTPPCSAPSHSPTPSHAPSTSTQIFLQAALACTGPRKPFLLLPIQRDDSTPKVLQVRPGASNGKSGNVKQRGSEASPLWGPIMSPRHP